MMEMNNKNKLQLVKLLSTTIAEKRLVINNAIANYITDIADDKVLYKDFVNNVCELAILRREDLLNTIYMYNDIKNNSRKIDNHLLANTFLELTDFGRVPQVEREAITANMNYYKKIYGMLVKYYGVDVKAVKDVVTPDTIVSGV